MKEIFKTLAWPPHKVMSRSPIGQQVALFLCANYRSNVVAEQYDDSSRSSILTPKCIYLFPNDYSVV